ncbi:GTP-binding protein [Candidatus Woesearchaeota archaeon CG_4_10_14_0_8_um_filter_47_5]|nr:MAG: GTP-binding protein [Candidatus Woesearchaeota archaeon CG_4_10_14_0_8_um_filter_47_5]
MVDYSGRITEFEEELKKTKYNKRTQHHIGIVKAKIARLRDQEEARIRGKSKGTGYSVRKSGDATAVLVGYPSVGKSTLLNALTNADSAVGAFDFTTLTVIPGTLVYNHAKIQILDVPGIVSGAASGKGRGKEVLQVVRSTDLIIFVVSVLNPEHYEALAKELYDSGVRMNQKRPDVSIKKKARGGISIGSTVPLELTRKTIVGILQEFRINNADVVIRSPLSVEEVIDVIEENKLYIPAITVLNKIDMVREEQVSGVERMLRPDVMVSAEKKTNIEMLKEKIFDRLDLMRIFCKEPGKPADLNEPMIIKRNATITNVCEKLHKDFVARFKFARVWGASAKFGGQKLMLKHVLRDNDVVELHIR